MRINSIQTYQNSFVGKYKSKDYNYITDPSGKFYAGMTRKEAELDGTDSSFWHRDFNNLDKDKNDILSVEEIFEERSRVSKNHKISAALFASFAALDAILPSSSKGEKFAFLLLDAAFIIIDLVGIHDISKGNKRYQRMMIETADKDNNTTNNA